MTLPSSVVFHFSPLDARQIGKLAEQFKATVLLATPTFLRNYIRRVEPHQFKTLEVVVVGAEKMPIEVADEFEKTFGMRPVEGYGTTELSPLVSVNIPPSRSAKPGDGLREGTVGRPIENVFARTVSLDDDSPLPTGQAGLLEIRGPNVMQGYYQRPDLTKDVMHGSGIAQATWASCMLTALSRSPAASVAFLRLVARWSRISKSKRLSAAFLVPTKKVLCKPP